jgi:glycosyltransferase involved in cell wall biosynthesis
VLSVVIPALNSASTISATLASIFSSTLSRDLFEVLVVDDGSSDSTVAVARRYPVKIYSCSERGIGPPRNLGIKMAKGDVVCFTDSDCAVEKDWLENIMDFFDRNPEADGVGGPVLAYPCSRNKVQRLTGEIFVEDQGYPEKLEKVQFGSMCGMILGSNSSYRKKAVSAAGGFSEPGGSNLELAWRLVSMGKNLFFDPNIRVSHMFPAEIASIFRQQFRWGTQSTQMKRRHGVFDGFREFVLISYFPVRRLLRPDSPKDLEKKLLHSAQLTSYGLGKVYGLSQ